MPSYLRIGLAAACICLGCSVVGLASAEEPPEETPNEGVTCAWRCHCARQLEDCDPEETQWDLCIDSALTRSPGPVDDCDECRRVANAECAQRVCPPDPAGGPKGVLELRCDGRRVAAATEPREVGEAVVASPSVAKPPSEAFAKLVSELEAADLDRLRTAVKVADGVTCSFACSCRIDDGYCDDHEKRSQMCSDKTESTLTASSCTLCEIRASFACMQRPCPLEQGVTKVMTRFSCADSSNS